MAANAPSGKNCANDNDDIRKEGKAAAETAAAAGGEEVSGAEEGKGQPAAADRSSEETNSTTATPASYSREGHLESSGNYSVGGGCFNPTVEALQVHIISQVKVGKRGNSVKAY